MSDNKEKIQQNLTIKETDILYELKIQLRFLRRKFSAYLRKTTGQKFINILIVTTDEVDYGFINSLKSQYPDKNVSVIIPITSDDFDGEKIHGSFEYFIQNRTEEAHLYKMHQNIENVTVYGVKSKIFSNDVNYDFSDIKYLTPFLKSVRYFAKKIKPDIIQSDYIPFFLGTEFDSGFNIPVIQMVRNLDEYNFIEPFWAALNFVNKKGMKKLCRDKVIKKYVATLFNESYKGKFKHMRMCLEIIFENYSRFRDMVKDGFNVEENIIFTRLNYRAAKLFPQMQSAGISYNPMLNSIKEADFWAVVSKTYYEEILKNHRFSAFLNKYKNQSDYILTLSQTKESGEKINIDYTNFRESKPKIKNYLLKELSYDRIRTKFTDKSIFDFDKTKTFGYLDTYDNSLLLYIKYPPKPDNESVKIGINAILKMFELNKNVQVIFNIPQVSSSQYMQSFVQFCEEHSSIDGRWILLEGCVNDSMFYAASDINLIPSFENTSDSSFMNAINYGCVPVCFSVGIYNDFIVDIFDDILSGNGFKVDINSTGAKEDVYLNTVFKALNLYFENSSAWNLIVKNCLNSANGLNFENIERFNNIYDKVLY